MPNEVPLIEVGPLRVSGPSRVRHGLWNVTAVDSVAEETVEHEFPTRREAQAFIDGLVQAVLPPTPDPLVEVAPLIELGPLRVSGPSRGRHDLWNVTAVDSVTEETVEREFPTRRAAQAFIDGLVQAVLPPTPDPMMEVAPQRRNGPLVPVTALAESGVQINRRSTRLDHRDGYKDPAKAKFNLKKVAEVLADHGLDPFAQLATILMKQQPVLDEQRMPVLDKNGDAKMVHVINDRDRAHLLIELGQYVAPKLKAVEMKVETNQQLTGEQLDEKIAALLAKQQAASG